MEIVHKKTEELHTNLLAGGQLEVLFDAPVGSKHYIWFGDRFVMGECQGDPRIGVPLLRSLPHLFNIMEIKEKTGVEPVIFVNVGLGVGIIFPNVV